MTSKKKTNGQKMKYDTIHEPNY